MTGTALFLWGLGIAAVLLFFMRHNSPDILNSSGEPPRERDRYRGTKIIYHKGSFDFTDGKGRNRLHLFLDAAHEVLGSKNMPSTLEVHPFGTKGAAQEGDTFHFYPAATARNGGLNIASNRILRAMTTDAQARRDIKKRCRTRLRK